MVWDASRRNRLQKLEEEGDLERIDLFEDLWNAKIKQQKKLDDLEKLLGEDIWKLRRSLWLSLFETRPTTKHTAYNLESQRRRL